MDKQADSVFRRSIDFVKANPDVVGGAIGAVGGGYAANKGSQALNEHHYKSERFKKMSPGKQKAERIAGTINTGLGTIVGGYYGAALGAGLGGKIGGNKARAYRHEYYSGRADKARANKTPPPDWLKGVKTQSEAKSRMKAEARKHHPDLGGDAEKMKNVNAGWDAFQKSDHWGKLKKSSVVMYTGFFNELGKIYSNE